MSDPKKPSDRDQDQAERDELARVRALILQRRNRFIAAAIAGLGAANSACSDTHDPNSKPPMNQAGDGGSGGQGGRGGSSGSGPTVCLTMLAGTGASGFGGAGNSGAGGAGTGVAGAGSGGAAGSRPQVCLEPPIDDCPNGLPPPCVCLSAPIDEDAGVE